MVQDTVYKAPLLSLFNQEEDEFKKSKREKEMLTEEEIQTKTDEDKKSFLGAHPTVVLLEANPILKKMRRVSFGLVDDDSEQRLRMLSSSQVSKKQNIIWRSRLAMPAKDEHANPTGKSYSKRYQT